MRFTTRPAPPLDNLGDLRWNWLASADNLHLDSADVAVDELEPIGDRLARPAQYALAIFLKRKRIT